MACCLIAAWRELKREGEIHHVRRPWGRLTSQRGEERRESLLQSLSKCNIEVPIQYQCELRADTAEKLTQMTLSYGSWPRHPLWPAPGESYCENWLAATSPSRKYQSLQPCWLQPAGWENLYIGLKSWPIWRSVCNRETREGREEAYIPEGYLCRRRLEKLWWLVLWLWENRSPLKLFSREGLSEAEENTSQRRGLSVQKMPICVTENDDTREEERNVIGYFKCREAEESWRGYVKKI